MMSPSRKNVWALATAVVLAAYALSAHFTPYPRYQYELSLFGNGLQTFLLLAASLVMVRNGFSSRGKTRYFWMFLALGVGIWCIGTAVWLWFETIVRRPMPDLFCGDILFFIHIVPIMAALAVRPHRLHSVHRLDFRSLDFAMLLLWWVYLYAFVVLPWQYILPDVDKYSNGFNLLYLVENIALLLSLAYLFLRVRGPWRLTYGWILLGIAIYSLGSQWANGAISRGVYYSGSIYDVPLVASMIVFLYLAAMGHKGNYPPMQEPANWVEKAFMSQISVLSVLSLPVIAAIGTFMANVPQAIMMFRLKVTAVALILLPLCVFLKQYLLDRELVVLLGASQRNLGNLKRLQAQLVQSEKLASLGELVAGAAHQISNPLTAIIGYSDLLEQDHQGEDEHAQWIRKIGQQARRTQELLKQMLKFAKQDPPEKLLMDLNRVVADAVELRELDLEDENIRILQRLNPKLPHLWGDSNQLLQVCFHIIGNAIDAMKVVGGGTLTVSTKYENGLAVVEFSDTGTGIADPQRIFDPFYTTKPVGKGAGLGLSAAYGIVTEHGGTIVCHNRPEGGATFILRFPIAHPIDHKSSQSAHA